MLHNSQSKVCFFCFVLFGRFYRGHGDKSFRKVLNRGSSFHLPNPDSPSFSLVDDARCEPIEIKKCQNLGYNYTRMPNGLGQERQVDADMELNTYVPLIETNCSRQVLFFLCAVYVPMCNQRIPTKPILPCESMCRAVEMRCEGILVSFGFEWPENLNCSRFPRQNGNGTLCMEGSEDEPIVRPPLSPGETQPVHTNCK